MHSSFPLAMASMLSTRHAPPIKAPVSYSYPAPSTGEKGPSLNLTTRPQPMGHPWQAYLPTNMVSAILLPDIFSAPSLQSPSCQFFMGKSPRASAGVIDRDVPYSMASLRDSFIFRILCLISDFNACALYKFEFIFPFAKTIAFNFFEPITAPKPHLPAARPCFPSCMILANFTKFSPATPIQEMAILCPSSLSRRPSIS